MNKAIFTPLLVIFGFHLLVAQASADFVTTWKTDNPGVSGPTQITIPTFPGATYNYDVDWDTDGVFDSLGVTGSITHDYGTADTVTIRIRGAFPRIFFSFGGDREKILSIDQWGAIKWTSMYEAFGGCTWLNSTATDAPDLSGVNDLSSMFYECASFNADISGWDVSHVNSMNFMFNSAYAFNQDISGWDVSRTGDFQNTFRNAHSFDQNLGDWDISVLSNAFGMFSESGLSVANYDSILIGWSTLDSGEEKIPLNAILGGSNLQYCAGEAARQKLLDVYKWKIYDGGQNCASLHFVTTWKTDNPGVSGPTRIAIPTFPGETYNYDVDWDNDGVFDSLGVTGSITYDYGVVDTVTIRIRGEFPRIYFNSTGDRRKLLSVDQWGDLAWTSMASAFQGCTNLVITATDKPDLSVAGSLNRMFKGCEAIDQFNSDAWDVSAVTDLSEMFSGCDRFNSPLNSWNVANVTDMTAMFNFCYAFNQPLDNWNVAKVTNMSFLFASCYAFNQDLGGWNTGNVTDMENMFYADSSFSQDLGSWNTGNVMNMAGMFSETAVFNQDIGHWDVSKVTDMTGMFEKAVLFDQNLGAWDVSQASQMWNMLLNTSLSTANYDSLLLGWSQRSLQSGVQFSAGNSQYCAGAGARQAIIDNFGWIITDGGLECVVGTGNPALPDALQVFPNPTTGLVTVQAGGYENAGLIRLLDQNGRCVVSRNVDQQEMLQLDLSMLPAGVYTLQYTGKSDSAQARVVKQ